MHAVRGKYTTQKNLRVTFISCSVASSGHEWPWIELRLEMSRSAGTGAAPDSKHWFTTSFLWRKVPESDARRVEQHLELFLCLALNSSDASCSCWLFWRLAVCSSDASCSFAGGACWPFWRLTLNLSDVSCSFAGGACWLLLRLTLCSSDAGRSFAGGACWLFWRLTLCSSDADCSFAGGACSGV